MNSKKHLQWSGDKENAVCIMLHDFNAVSHRFAGLGEYLSGQSITCIAPDLLLPDSKKRVEVVTSKSIDGAFDIINSIISEKRKLFKDIPFFLCGEGYGAILALKFASDFSSLLSGVVLMAPFFKFSFSLVRSGKLVFDYLLRPQKRYFLPIKHSMITKDKWYLSALADSGEHAYAYSAHFIGDFMLISRRAFRNKLLNVPVLMLLASDDLLAENKVSHRFYQDLKDEDKTINYYGEFHALSIPEDRDSVYSDLARWMKQHIISM